MRVPCDVKSEVKMNEALKRRQGFPRRLASTGGRYYAIGAGLSVSFPDLSRGSLISSRGRSRTAIENRV